MAPVLLALSLIIFLVINAAPGDFVDAYEAKIRSTPMGARQLEQQLKFLDGMRIAYGLDKPLLQQYLTWIWKIFTQGDFGYSFTSLRPVSELIWEKLGWTLLLTTLAMAVTVVLGFAIGVYSAVHQYSILDYLFNALAFLALAIPNFFLALLLMSLLVFTFRVESVGGFFSAEYMAAPWSAAKLLDLLRHLWLPVLIISMGATGENIRIVRGNLLDILGQPYLQTARAKGLAKRTVIYRHALRNSLHPMIMKLGASLPALIAGEIIVSVMLGLPTVGYTFYEALRSQDVYLAGTFLMLSALVLQIGNLLADIALVYVDPTIRYD
jgi:peptide/nickel transport system permease protein